MTAAVGVHVDQEAFDSADALLTQIPFELRNKVVTRAIRESGKVYQSYLAAELESKLNSMMTGTRDKQSKSVRESRPDRHLYETVIVKSAAYGSTEIGVVGPDWPAGNLVNLWVSSYQQPLWGMLGSIENPITIPVAYDISAKVASSAEGFMSAKFLEEMKAGSERVLRQLARAAKKSAKGK